MNIPAKDADTFGRALIKDLPDALVAKPPIGIHQNKNGRYHMVQTLEKPKVHKPLWIFRTCPKCKIGDLYLERGDLASAFEDYYSCLQCGYTEIPLELLDYKNPKKIK